MPEFVSWRSYERFAYRVKRESRYVRDANSQTFLETVLATSHVRRKTIPAGTNFWRAQQGYGSSTESQEDIEYILPAPHAPERMRPLEDSAREGRVNPKGIPCLYLATDRDTAMGEVRPWLGLQVSVGQFKTRRDLLVVDCSVLHGTERTWYFEEPPPVDREQAIWAAIDQAFSEPVNPDESTADYAPTQVLAEVFRTDGCDGVVYKSLLGKGHNVALFGVDDADLVNCFLYEPKTISFTFEEIANPYFIEKQLGKG